MPVTVSVIIGAYNAEKFLPAGLDCILEQTYKDLDIVIVDDGSTDETGVICGSLAAKDTRIRVFHKDNGGLASARNYGLDQARGAYIAFYDVDDSVDPDWIEENVKLLEASNAEMAMHGFTVFDQDAGQLDTIRFPSLHFRSNKELRENFAKYFVFVRHGNGFVWNKIYRKSFLDAVHARFGGERIRQDEPFNLRLYLRVTNIVIGGGTPYHYIVHKGKIASKYISERFGICQSIYLGFGVFCRQWGIDRPELQDYNAARHVGDIISVITSDLLHPDCPLTLGQRRAAALSIMKDPHTKECLARICQGAVSPGRAVFLFCLRHDLPLAMLVIGGAGKMIRKAIGK